MPSASRGPTGPFGLEAQIEHERQRRRARPQRGKPRTPVLRPTAQRATRRSRRSTSRCRCPEASQAMRVMCAGRRGRCADSAAETSARPARTSPASRSSSTASASHHHERLPANRRAGQADVVGRADPAQVRARGKLRRIRRAPAASGPIRSHRPLTTSGTSHTGLSAASSGLAVDWHASRGRNAGDAIDAALQAGPSPSRPRSARGRRADIADIQRLVGRRCSCPGGPASTSRFGSSLRQAAASVARVAAKFRRGSVRWIMAAQNAVEDQHGVRLGQRVPRRSQAAGGRRSPRRGRFAATPETAAGARPSKRASTFGWRCSASVCNRRGPLGRIGPAALRPHRPGSLAAAAQVSHCGRISRSVASSSASCCRSAGESSPRPCLAASSSRRLCASAEAVSSVVELLLFGRVQPIERLASSASTSTALKKNGSAYRSRSSGFADAGQLKIVLARQAVERQMKRLERLARRLPALRRSARAPAAAAGCPAPSCQAASFQAAGSNVSPGRDHELASLLHILLAGAARISPGSWRPATTTRRASASTS